MQVLSFMFLSSNGFRVTSGGFIADWSNRVLCYHLALVIAVFHQHIICCVPG